MNSCEDLFPRPCLPSYNSDQQEVQDLQGDQRIQDLQEVHRIQDLQEFQDLQVVHNQHEVLNLQNVQDLQEVPDLQNVQDLQEDQEVEGSRRSAVPGSSDFLSEQTSTSFLPEPCVQRLTASELLRNR